jgi:phage shock protein PspC (stress-responsive transcriptional regulator)
MSTRRLTRSRTEKKLAGVCAGLAEYLEVDVVLVRAAFVVFTLLGAIVGGVIVYVAAWLLMPESTEPFAPPLRRRLTLSESDRQLAGVCGGLAEYFGVDSTLVRLLWVIVSIFVGAIIGGLIAYLVAWLIIPRPASIVVTPAPVSTV